MYDIAAGKKGKEGADDGGWHMDAALSFTLFRSASISLFQCQGLAHCMWLLSLSPSYWSLHPVGLFLPYIIGCCNMSSSVCWLWSCELEPILFTLCLVSFSFFALSTVGTEFEICWYDYTLTQWISKHVCLGPHHSIFPCWKLIDKRLQNSSVLWSQGFVWFVRWMMEW